MINKYDLVLFGIGTLLSKGIVLELLTESPVLPITTGISWVLVIYALFISPPNKNSIV